VALSWRGEYSEMRIQTKRFPTSKAIEKFNLDHPPTLPRDVLVHLGTNQFIINGQEAVLFGPRSGKDTFVDRFGIVPPSTNIACCSSPPLTESLTCSVTPRPASGRPFLQFPARPCLARQLPVPARRERSANWKGHLPQER